MYGRKHLAPRDCDKPTLPVRCLFRSQGEDADTRSLSKLAEWTTRWKQDCRLRVNLDIRRFWRMLDLSQERQVRRSPLLLCSVIWIGVSNVLHRLSYARGCGVIVVALTAERIAAAFDATVRTNRCSAVGTRCDGRLAARCSDVAVAGGVFNQADHSCSAHARAQQCQPGAGSLWRSRSNNFSRPSICE
jgi:hypothetical protein